MQQKRGTDFDWEQIKILFLEKLYKNSNNKLNQQKYLNVRRYNSLYMNFCMCIGQNRNVLPAVSHGPCDEC